MEQFEKATLAAGCFWCYEPIFRKLKGVRSIRVGYTGGETHNPSYDEVSSRNTGHAEAFEIEFNPKIISFREILEVFWRVHDPTTLNRQGNDVGSQYRSEIFYHSPAQEQTATALKKELDESGEFNNPIVTKISPAQEFFEAENYHQNYYEQNPESGYCQVVIRPKVEKFEHLFADKLK